MAGDWNAELYQARHSFVWERGRELLELLDPKPGERILDVGCGPGQLTTEIARSGAQVLGIDKSPAMLAEARRNFPELRFESRDVCELDYNAEFDAVFSNAVLHWVDRADDAAEAMARALKPGGRLVVEFGGRGNLQILLESALRALESLGVANPERFATWYYPRLGEYAALLERHGLEVTFARLFDRPTPLAKGAEGLRTWMSTFRADLLATLGEERREEFLRLVERFAAPRLLRDGQWFADYRRLRVVASK